MSICFSVIQFYNNFCYNILSLKSDLYFSWFTSLLLLDDYLFIYCCLHILLLYLHYILVLTARTIDFSTAADLQCVQRRYATNNIVGLTRKKADVLFPGRTEKAAVLESGELLSDDFIVRTAKIFRKQGDGKPGSVAGRTLSLFIRSPD